MLEKGFKNFWELSDELTKFDVKVDITLIVYIFATKILFFKKKGWCEKIVKCGDAQGVIKNKQIIIKAHAIFSLF